MRVPLEEHGRHKAFLSGENYCIDVYSDANGDWGFEGTNLFQANDPKFVPAWQKLDPRPTLLMKIRKGDLLKLEENGQAAIYRVIKLAPTNRTFWLAQHQESGNLQQRHDDPDDPFRWLFLTFGQMKARKARLVTVDITGRVNDRGPFE